jgi:hypothetical protein
MTLTDCLYVGAHLGPTCRDTKLRDKPASAARESPTNKLLYFLPIYRSIYARNNKLFYAIM